MHQLEDALEDDPSASLVEGGLIRSGWDGEIDRLREIQVNGKRSMEDYIAEEKAAVGIPSFKLKFNRGNWSFHRSFQKSG